MSPGWPILEGPYGGYADLIAKQQQCLFGTITGLSTALREARVTFYCIEPLWARDDRSFLHPDYYKEFLKGVRKPGQTQGGNLALQVISTQTGETGAELK